MEAIGRGCVRLEVKGGKMMSEYVFPKLNGLVNSLHGRRGPVKSPPTSSEAVLKTNAEETRE